MILNAILNGRNRRTCVIIGKIFIENIQESYTKVTTTLNNFSSSWKERENIKGKIFRVQAKANGKEERGEKRKNNVECNFWYMSIRYKGKIIESKED